MALESATYISDLVSTNPTSSDPLAQGDDHIRLLKSTLKATFPNVSGAVTPTHTELNYVDGVTSSIQTQLDAKAGLGTVNTFTSNQTVGSGSGAISLAVDGGNASAKTLVYRVGGLNRWIAQASSTAESGSNAGSDYVVSRFTDAGAYIDIPLQITRSTGVTTLKELNLTAPLAVSQGGTGGTNQITARTGLGLGTLATLNAVGATEITDGSVGAAELAANAVTTTKILDANVTTAKIADASVTPAKLSGGQSGSAPVYGVRAWVTFDGTVASPTISASGNVTSVTKNGTGDYTINFTTALPNANYAVSVTGYAGSGTGLTGTVSSGTAPTTSSVRVQLSFYGYPASSANSGSADSSRVSVMVVG